MAEEPTETANNVRGGDRVTIAQAAALLGVHPNTVRNRVKDGVYDAEKVVTENGQTWMIARNSLLNNALPKGSQQAPSQRKPNVELQATELVQELLRPFVEDLGRVREELGAERVRRKQAEREREELRLRLEAALEARESPETASEEPYSTHAPPQPMTPVQRLSERVEEAVDRGNVPPGEPRPQHPVERPSWWRKFFGLE
jgi:hypothetical protein